MTYAYSYESEICMVDVVHLLCYPTLPMRAEVQS